MSTKINLIMLGEPGVGKTCLLNRFITGIYRESMKSTFVDYFTKTLKFRGTDINLVLWDTAGQERFYSLIRRYFATADGVLLVYDVNERFTLDGLSRWLKELREINETAEVVIVGNKNEGQPAANSSTIQKFAQQENLECLQVSAKTGENVDKVFQCLTEKILIAKGVLPYPEFSLTNILKDQDKDPKNNSANKEPEITFSYLRGPSVPAQTKTIKLVEEEKYTRRYCYC